MINIDEVQAHGLVADTDFARTGFTHRHIDEVQFFRAAGFVEMNSFAHACLL